MATESTEMPRWGCILMLLWFVGLPGYAIIHKVFFPPLEEAPISYATTFVHCDIKIGKGKRVGAHDVVQVYLTAMMSSGSKVLDAGTTQPITFSRLEDGFPLPTVDDMLDGMRLGGGRMFNASASEYELITSKPFDPSCRCVVKMWVSELYPALSETAMDKYLDTVFDYPLKSTTVPANRIFEEAGQRPIPEYWTYQVPNDSHE